MTAPRDTPHTSDAGPAPTGDRTVDRRTLLTGAGGLLGGLSTLGIPTGVQGAFAATGTDPVSMAMHIHGSFSEGIASMDAHLYQAKRLGVDVVWWTDHDFRINAYGYRDAIGFDGPREVDGAYDLTWSDVVDPSIASSSHAFVSSPANPDEAGDKLRMTAKAGPAAAWASYLLEAEAQNTTYSTSYCDTSLDIDVRPQTQSDDTQVVIEIVSSYRPATGGRPAGQYRLEYRIGDTPGYRTEDDGLTGVIGIAGVTADQWHRITMDLRADHARLWPDTVADDASLWRLRLGVRVRNGATAQVILDRLKINRTRAYPASGMALLEDVVAQYADRYPSVTHYAAAEVSLVMHLNMFGGDRTLPTYAHPGKDPSVGAQRDMIKFLHGNGATVALNHPLQGAPSPNALAQRLLTTHGQGADVIEIGTGRGTPKLIRVFDILSRNAVFLTANGTTDDHQGTDWLVGRNWLTRAWSPTKRRVDLCAAMEAGRAWFYNPARWDGALDIVVEGKRRMGGVLFTRKQRVDVSVLATALPSNAVVDLVIGRCDLAGPDVLAPANRFRRIAARSFVGGRHALRIDRGNGVYIRAAVKTADGALIGFSNPVWVLPVSKRESIRVPQQRR